MGFVVYFGFDLMSNAWFVWQLAVLVPLGGLVYLLLMFKTKAITPEMMKLIRKK